MQNSINTASLWYVKLPIKIRVDASNIPVNWIFKAHFMICQAANQHTRVDTSNGSLCEILPSTYLLCLFMVCQAANQHEAL